MTELLSLTDRKYEQASLLWDNDEFIDVVDGTLDFLYKSKLSATCKRNRTPYEIWPSDIKKIRNLGAYFQPPNMESGVRLMREYIGNPDHVAASSLYHEGLVSDEEWERPDKLSLCYLRRIHGNGHNSLLRTRDRPLFVFYRLYSKGRKFIAAKEYVEIDPDGSFIPVLARMKNNKTSIHQGNAKKYELSHPVKNGKFDETSLRDMKSTSFLSSMTMNNWMDRRMYWLVETAETEPGGATAKATFGVWDDQIKSLFYARTKPMTEAGRKRPVLHWVEAHKRRMQNGSEIDVQEHLRGSNEFVMEGTRFRIFQPMKAPGESYADTYPKKDGRMAPIGLQRTVAKRVPIKMPVYRKYTDWLLDTFIRPFKRR